MRSPRRSIIGSYRYSVVIKPTKAEYSDSMSGVLELYDGKHVIETHKFDTFDQLASTIINYWEKKLGSDVNVHRFSNWLSEYFSDIGITNINFYQMLETVIGLGQGVALQSSGVAIREAKVIQEYLGSTDDEVEKAVKLQAVGTFVDVRGEGMEPVPEKLRPEEPPTDTVLKPSEIFKTAETISPVVTHLPTVKEEEKEKPAPPTNTLLKPSEVLKERDSVVFAEEPSKAPTQVSGDPVITAPTEKTTRDTPPTDSLLKPSEYLKKRETIEVIFEIDIKPSTIPEEKKIKSVIGESKTILTHQKLKPPSEILLKPSESITEIEERSLKPPIRIDPEVKKIPSPPLSEKVESDEDEIKSEIDESGKEVIDFEIEVKAEKEPLEVTFREIKTIDKLRVTDIMGVGDKIAMLLKEGGFDSIQKIMETTPEKLSKLRGIGVTTAKKLIYGAKALVKREVEE